MQRYLIAAALLAAAAPAATRAKDTPASPLITALTACKAETDDARRLACYDKAAGALATATAKGEIAVVDREDVRKTRRSLFGFTLPKLPFFSDDDSAKDTPTEIETTAASVRAEGFGKFQVTMADGAVWRTTEVSRRDPRPGSKIRLKKGLMGGYMMNIDGATAVRASRIG